MTMQTITLRLIALSLLFLAGNAIADTKGEQQQPNIVFL